MPEAINLSENINKQLPGELVDFLRSAGGLVQGSGQKLYLVGGAVRDLLLNRSNFDLDLVLEGDAISLAQRLGGLGWGRIATHPSFGTAKLQWNEWNVDLASARSETYARPGALPSIQSGSIQEDLFRRDFTINAMAVQLNAGYFGRLFDLYGGNKDLERRLMRVLHEKSFIDDATRIWRGLRYEQRLGFHLEPATLRWLRRDMSYLDTVSGDRVRHELELVLKEERPERVLRRADELGVLPKLHPDLKGNGWLAEKFAQARRERLPDVSLTGLYLALFTYSLNSDQIEQFISYLRLRKLVTRTLRDTVDLKNKLGTLAEVKLSPSHIFSILHGYSSTAVIANSIASESTVARERIDLYLKKLHSVKPALTGEDLKNMGIVQGPDIKKTLNLLLDARLDGTVTNRQQEEELVRTVVR
jgi:tRNA nucleotidyltransferase (CCA-adding enzyme)